MSSSGVPFCCRWIMSDLAKTVQRPAMRAGFSDCMAMLANSFSISISSRSACWSRKAPVPAAQRLLSAMSTSTILPSVSSHFTDMNLLSCPPISTIVRAWGTYSPMARTWATSSLTCRPPSSSETGRPPEPVKPTAVAACGQLVQRHAEFASHAGGVFEYGRAGASLRTCVSPRQQVQVLVNRHDLDGCRTDINTQV